MAHEIVHGRRLAAAEAEAQWGWATPAGQLRARRRTGFFTGMFAATGARIVAVDISPELFVLQAPGRPGRILQRERTRSGHTITCFSTPSRRVAESS